MIMVQEEVVKIAPLRTPPLSCRTSPPRVGRLAGMGVAPTWWRTMQGFLLLISYTVDMPHLRAPLCPAGHLPHGWGDWLAWMTRLSFNIGSRHRRE